MRIDIWVLSTCAENKPGLPEVFADEAAAYARYREALAIEWQYDGPQDANGVPLPQPATPEETNKALAEYCGREWGEWELTKHTLESRLLTLVTEFYDRLFRAASGRQRAGSGRQARDQGIDRCRIARRGIDVNANYGERDMKTGRTGQVRFEFFDVGGPNNFAGDEADKGTLHWHYAGANLIVLRKRRRPSFCRRLIASCVMQPRGQGNVARLKSEGGRRLCALLVAMW